MNRPLGRHGCKCEDNIKVNLKDRNRVFIDSSILNRNHLLAVVGMLLQKARNLLASRLTGCDLFQGFAPPS
jgi:hypothetical protein